MIKRASKKYIDNLIKGNLHWNILDVGCGYTAHENANTVCDTQDLSNFYKEKNFIKLNSKNLPFNDKEFDFVIASHVMEHVENLQFFISELERVSKRGYIEVPTKLEDNLVFENKKDHLWHMEFDDDNLSLIISKKKQYFEPILTVSSIKDLNKYFKSSLVIQLYWENKIDYSIIDGENQEFKKFSLLMFFRKFVSKKLRSLFK